MSTFVRKGNQSPETQVEKELAKMSPTDRAAIKKLMNEGRDLKQAIRAYRSAWC